MIALAFAVILFIVAAVFLVGAIRAWPPGKYRPMYLRPSSVSDLVLGLGVSAAAAVGGILLLRL